MEHFITRSLTFHFDLNRFNLRLKVSMNIKSRAASKSRTSQYRHPCTSLTTTEEQHCLVATVMRMFITFSFLHTYWTSICRHNIKFNKEVSSQNIKHYYICQKFYCHLVQAAAFLISLIQIEPKLGYISKIDLKVESCLIKFKV